MTGTSATSSVAIPDATVPVRTAPDSASEAVGVIDRARAKLERHADLWSRRPLIRDIYRGYHQAILNARSRRSGIALEVGSGHGSLAESQPGVISCDVVPCPWLDCAADATRLPFGDESVSNIIMIDVLHHVAHPAEFFAEAERTLVPGGRILMIEPYVSPVSWIAWRFFCDEPFDPSVDPLSSSAGQGTVDGADPWESNVAVPTLLFWRDLDVFRHRFPGLRIVRRRRFDLILYPLSGGFERRRFIPMPLVPFMRACERILTPLAPLLAFRCFVVIEKSARTTR